jgi:hypothetical protein
MPSSSDTKYSEAVVLGSYDQTSPPPFNQKNNEINKRGGEGKKQTPMSWRTCRKRINAAVYERTGLEHELFFAIYSQRVTRVSPRFLLIAVAKLPTLRSWLKTCREASELAGTNPLRG